MPSYETSSSTVGLTSDKFRSGPKCGNRIGIGILVIGAIGIIIGLAVGIPLSKRDTSGSDSVTNQGGSGGGTGGIVETDRAKAVRLLTDNPLIDGHNDLPWQLRQYVQNKIYNVDLSTDTVSQWPPPPALNMTDMSFPIIPPQTDIPRLRQGYVAAQWWAIFVSCASTQKDAVRQGLDQTDAIHKFINKYPDFVLVVSADGIEAAFRDHKIGSLIGLEGGHMIGSTLGIIRMYYLLGVRYMTLTHSCDTPWADSFKADIRNPPSKRGLTEFGKKVVFELNRIGMIIDLSHTGYYTQKHTLNITRAPVIFSHSSVFTLCNHYRNVQDDILNMTRDNKGLVMINFYNHFINCGANKTENTTISQVADHIDYVKNYIGVDYVGIGADYDGVPVMPQGLGDVSTYPDIFAELIRRGWSNADLIKLAGGNMLRVFRRVEQVRDDLVNEQPYEDLIDPEDIPNRNCTTSI